MTTSIKGEKPGVEDLARYVEGIKDHDWKKSATLKLQDASLAKKGEAWVYTLDEGTAVPERYVIRFRCKSAVAAGLPRRRQAHRGQRLFCQWDAKTFGLPDPGAGAVSAPRKRPPPKIDSSRNFPATRRASGSRPSTPWSAWAARRRFLLSCKSRPSGKKKTIGTATPLAAPWECSATKASCPNWFTSRITTTGIRGSGPEISLLRLTGQNFGRDVAAWRQWWQKQGGKPPISGETVVWATSPRLLSELEGAEDPNKQEEMDRQAMETIIKARKPQIVSLTPPNGAKDVDPALPAPRQVRCADGQGLLLDGRRIGIPQVARGQRALLVRRPQDLALPVKLEPGHEYRLGLNSPSFQNFQSAAGIPLEPVVYSFKTRDK